MENNEISFKDITLLFIGSSVFTILLGGFLLYCVINNIFLSDAFGMAAAVVIIFGVISITSGYKFFIDLQNKIVAKIK